MKGGQITIKDIAKELNISISTVSRALKDYPHINNETKRKVVELAEKLNYAPNSIALSLRVQRTNTIGIIIPEIVHFFFSTVIAGIQEVANEAGYSIMIYQSKESYEREVFDTKTLINQRVDGLLVAFSRETINFDHFKKVKEKNIPIVFFDRMTEEIDASHVVVEDYEGAKKATEHLLEQGCKHIVHIAGSRNLNLSKERARGYNDVMKECGLIPEVEYLQECEGYTEEGYRCTKKLLKLSTPPDAIFATCDMVALGAMQAIKEAGLKIPKDIALVGFSNWRFSELIEPQLSSISQSGIDMGRKAARLLLDELDSKGKAVTYKTEVLPTELIIRSSSLKSGVLIDSSTP